MPELKTGDDFPEGVTFAYIPIDAENSDVTSCGVPQKYNASEEFKKKKVILVAVPGAFTPTCQVSHVPSYLNNAEELKKKGVDQVIFIASNDQWVMSAWGKANGVKDDFVIFASDADLSFSKSIDWEKGGRAQRYAIVVDHGKVVYAARETAAGSIENSGADGVIPKL